MRMKRYESFDEYVADQTSRKRAVIQSLRRLVQRVAPHLQESVMWGNGCWLCGPEPIAYVYAASDHVQFGFVMGSALKDPRKLLVGAGAFVRHIRVFSGSDIDERYFADMLLQAASKKRPGRGHTKKSRNRRSRTVRRTR